ncbi:MAG: hypothetical protein ACI8RD_011436 [Bacillariaceae sp.]|jgi:hypothetical protein
MDASIDNEENDDQQRADEKEQAAAAAAAAAAKLRCLKVISVLERKEQFPLETRYEMDELVEEFLDKVEGNIQRLLYDTKNPESYEYDGFDCNDHHTEEEVETAVRFFPDVLSREKKLMYVGTTDCIGTRRMTITMTMSSEGSSIQFTYSHSHAAKTTPGGATRRLYRLSLS